MSTEKIKSPFDQRTYDVGIWKWVGSAKINGDKTDVSTKSLLIPTYGSCAGPEWASGDRAPMEKSGQVFAWLMLKKRKDIPMCSAQGTIPPALRTTLRLFLAGVI